MMDEYCKTCGEVASMCCCDGKDEIARLREELAEVKLQLQTAYPLSDTVQHWKQRAELAEAKIREAEGQEPIAWHDRRDAWLSTPDGCNFADDVCHPLYPRPIPPADVQELQAKAADYYSQLGGAHMRIAELERGLKNEMNKSFALESEVDELERKLEEQQAMGALDVEKLHSLGWDVSVCTICGESMSATSKARAEAAPEWIDRGDK